MGGNMVLANDILFCLVLYALCYNKEIRKYIYSEFSNVENLELIADTVV